MRLKLLHLVVLITLAAASLYAQTNPVYYSSTAPDCSALGGETPITVNNQQDVAVGYSCYVGGTFVWLAAGGVWGTTIRVAAPASNAVGVAYGFFDPNGLALSLDTTVDDARSSFASGSSVEFALYANQPAEVELIGATSDAPNYTSTATGSVYAIFLCPDAPTCLAVLPQLIYSALPTYSWSLSVPIAWDDYLATQWSAEGIDDGSTHVVSLVVYNENTTAATYTVSVYDSNGNLAGSGTTPVIPPFQSSTYEAGSYATLLSGLVSPLPSGLFKVVIDGGTMLSAVEVLQITGASATTLQVAVDPPTGELSAIRPRKSSVKRLLVHPPTRVLPPLTK